MTDLGVVELEILRNALVAASEEMSVTVWRTSRSSVVREILDYSTCIFDADGDSVAQAARMPVHLNSMASCLRDLLDGPLPAEHWHAGDVVLTNDPYSGGQHLSDWLTFSPVFVDGRRVAIVGILVHHLDVGGGAPGSYDPGATEIYQEGIRIPPVKVVDAGVRNEALIATLMRNSREPVNVGGDFGSQLAALQVGAHSVEALARRYGSNAFIAAAKAIQAQSEAAMRAAIARIPDGEYAFEDFVDDDGIDSARLRVAVRLTVHGDNVTIDLDGSSAQATGPVNCTRNMSSSAVVCGVLMAVGRDIPANAGVYRPIRIDAPAGSIVNALSPAPVANRMAVGHRVVNAVLGAFAQALPDEVPASYYGVSYAYALSCENDDGERQVYFDLECGGWGAHPRADGANALSCGFHNIANSPVEMIEQTYPVRFVEYALRPDSGGDGRTRGGLGLVREFELLGPAGSFAANLDRFQVPPYGLDGGASGAPGRLAVRRAGDSDWQPLASKVRGVALVRGDGLRLETSGGGGHGDPASRDVRARENDLAQGYVTAAGGAAMAGCSLRPATRADVDRLVALLRVPEVHRYFADGVEPTRRQSEEWVGRHDAASDAASGLGLWLLEDCTGRLLGCVSLEATDAPRTAELIYLLHPEVWGQGLATAMAWTVLERGFADQQLDRIVAGADVPNTASVAVMQRLGMTYARPVEYPMGPGVEYTLHVDDPKLGCPPPTIAWRP